MSTRSLVLLLVFVGLGAVVAGMLTSHLLREPEAPAQSAAEMAPAPPGEASGDAPPRRPDFQLQDLDGQTHEAAEWDGRLLVVNFWATWCPPCREEIPWFMDIQAALGGQGVQFLGIAIDEPFEVARFLTETPLNYPTLVGGADAMEVSREFGNTLGALPFTAIVDRDGRIVFTWRGALKRETLEQALTELL